MAVQKQEVPNAIELFTRLRESGKFFNAWLIHYQFPSHQTEGQKGPGVHHHTPVLPGASLVHPKSKKQLLGEELCIHKPAILNYLRSVEAQAIPTLKLLEIWCSLVAEDYTGPSGSTVATLEENFIRLVSQHHVHPNWRALLQDLDGALSKYNYLRNLRLMQTESADTASTSQAGDTSLLHLHVRWQSLRMHHFVQFPEPLTNTYLGAFAETHLPETERLQTASLQYRLSFAMYAYQFAEARIARFGMSDSLARSCLEKAYLALGLEQQEKLAMLDGFSSYLAYLIVKGLNVECFRHVARNLKPKWQPDVFLSLSRNTFGYQGIPELTYKVSVPNISTNVPVNKYPAPLFTMDTRQNLYSFVGRRALTPRRLLGWAMGLLGVALLLGSLFIPATTLLLTLVAAFAAIAGITLMIAGCIQARYYRDELNSPAVRQLHTDILQQRWIIAELQACQLNVPKIAEQEWQNHGVGFWSSRQLVPPQVSPQAEASQAPVSVKP